ncbi:MAG: hypothetical protein CMM80_05290 [Rhodospirillaceae bacterium]|nr:hypothetical protein [Rhodospirillaceae bacterium]|tara:strand:- start:111 stop:401 length:291 start_codon:yes stop_codon:yes gene_type:complete
MSFQKWSPDELKEAVKAYNQMRDLEISGKKFVKAEIIRGLIAGSLKNRSKGSIEKRFQNISSVYQHRGEAWVKGYKPLSHVGTNVLREIIDIIESQ